MIKFSNLMMLVIWVITGIVFTSCNKPVNEARAAEPEVTDQDYILKGKYLVTIGGCNDCHTPKLFENGQLKLDESRLLSGHTDGSPLPPIDTKALEPGNWMLLAGDLTVAVGPWGMSYAKNLTPHETGMKGWSLEVFTKAMRTGKHMGVEQGRPIMPPMPWEALSLQSDEDLKAIYMYLQSVPPVDNHVPDPISPDQVRQLAGAS